MKTSLPFAVALGIALPYGLLAQQAHTQSTGPTLTEDQVFDATREAPLALLRRLYEEKKVLLLGEPDHTYETTYNLLIALLDEIGSDPRLKYVVLERPRAHGSVYEDLSVNHMSETDIKEKLLPQKDLVICDRTIALTYARLLPQIRAANASRAADNKVLLTSIDGIANATGVKRAFVTSTQREMKTSENFRDRLWKNLGPSEKAIVVYHQAHIIKGFTQPFQSPVGEVGASWLSIFLQQHPNATTDMGVVLVDHADTQGNVALKFTQRQTARYPGQSWGIRLDPFASIATERGIEAFTPESFWTQYTGAAYPTFLHPDGQIERVRAVSTSTLAEMAGAVIWRSDVAHESIKPASTYLPTACGSR
jgi:hypothetical protein